MRAAERLVARLVEPRGNLQHLDRADAARAAFQRVCGVLDDIVLSRSECVADLRDKPVDVRAIAFEQPVHERRIGSIAS